LDPGKKMGKCCYCKSKWAYVLKLAKKWFIETRIHNRLVVGVILNFATIFIVLKNIIYELFIKIIY
jgi:hypothetical protein